MRCPFYCIFYADLCKAIAKRKAPSNTKQEHVFIKELIIHKCQEVFDIAYKEIEVINEQEKNSTEHVKVCRLKIWFKNYRIY